MRVFVCAVHFRSQHTHQSSNTNVRWENGGSGQAGSLGLNRELSQLQLLQHSGTVLEPISSS